MELLRYDMKGIDGKSPTEWKGMEGLIPMESPRLPLL